MAKEVLKGWVRLPLEEKEYHAVRLYVTKPSRRSTGGIRIYIYNYGYESQYIVTTSGLYLYIKDATFPTLKQAIEFAKKIMKYVNYGRFELKILREDIFG